MAFKMLLMFAYLVLVFSVMWIVKVGSASDGAISILTWLVATASLYVLYSPSARRQRVFKNHRDCKFCGEAKEDGARK